MSRSYRGKPLPGQMDHARFGYPLLNAKVAGAPLIADRDRRQGPGAGGGAIRRHVAGGVGSWLSMNESPDSLALLSALASGSWKRRRTGIAPG